MPIINNTQEYSNNADVPLEAHDTLIYKLHLCLLPPLSRSSEAQLL